MKLQLKKQVLSALIVGLALTGSVANAETPAEREERLFKEQSELLNTPKGQMLYQLGLLGSSAATLSACKGGTSTVKAFEKVFKTKAVLEYEAAGGTQAEFFQVYDGAKSKTAASKPKPSAQNCAELSEQLKGITESLK